MRHVIWKPVSKILWTFKMPLEEMKCNSKHFTYLKEKKYEDRTDGIKNIMTNSILSRSATILNVI